MTSSPGSGLTAATAAWIAPVPVVVATAYWAPWRVAKASPKALTLKPERQPSVALSMTSMRWRRSSSPKIHLGPKGWLRKGAPPSTANFALVMGLFLVWSRIFWIVIDFQDGFSMMRLESRHSWGLTGFQPGWRARRSLGMGDVWRRQYLGLGGGVRSQAHRLVRRHRVGRGCLMGGVAGGIPPHKGGPKARPPKGEERVERSEE